MPGVAGGPFFLITIDTEGDDLWARPRTISTRNADYLPRFQALCESHGFRPTYLANYEMAVAPAFQEFGRDLMRRRVGEIGMHLHAWNTPPEQPLTADDHVHHPYLIEYALATMRAKVQALTELLEDTFGTPMRTHRAGRWAMDERYARILVESGYRVDCSVTPGVSWTHHPGAPDGGGGTDYRAYPHTWYFVDPDDLQCPGSSPLLEVPVTIAPDCRTSTRWARRLAAPFPPALRAINRMAPPVRWLRPNGRNGRGLLEVLGHRIVAEAGYAEFMLHSSELMPGGSPSFRTTQSIEALYGDLDMLFGRAAERFRPATLGEFHGAVLRSRPDLLPLRRNCLGVGASGRGTSRGLQRTEADSASGLGS